MNKQLRNSITAKQYIPQGDVNTLPSCTEPDQTLSIKQIIERHTNGINMGVQEYQPYYSEEEMPDFEHMSFDELHSYREFLSNRRYELEDKLREHKQRELQMRQEENEKSIIEKYKKSIETDSSTPLV